MLPTEIDIGELKIKSLRTESKIENHTTLDYKLIPIAEHNM